MIFQNTHLSLFLHSPVFIEYSPPPSTTLSDRRVTLWCESSMTRNVLSHLFNFLSIHLDTLIECPLSDDRNQQGLSPILLYENNIST